MSTTIYNLNHGRAIGSYDLLDDIQELTGLPRTEAHSAIHATLQQLVELDGAGIILDSQPVRPELLRHNPHDLDIDRWLTISDETAQEIREAITADHNAETA